MITRTLPTGREGRILAAGIAVLALVMVWVVLISPVIGWYAARDDALQQRIAYASRIAAIVADLPEAEQAAAAARSQAAPSRMILDGSSDPIAGAALESIIDGLTHDAQATLVSTEAMQAVQQGSFRRIGLHVTVRAPWANLVQLLAGIEGAEPRMSIGDLQMQAGPLGTSEPLLDMTFSAMAFRAGTATAADTAAAADAAAATDNSQ